MLIVVILMNKNKSICKLYVHSYFLFYFWFYIEKESLKTCEEEVFINTHTFSLFILAILIRNYNVSPLHQLNINASQSANKRPYGREVYMFASKLSISTENLKLFSSSDGNGN